jgi:hypothetical protein
MTERAFLINYWGATGDPMWGIEYWQEGEHRPPLLTRRKPDHPVRVIAVYELAPPQHGLPLNDLAAAAERGWLERTAL